jgi:hypothetical protein
LKKFATMGLALLAVLAVAAVAFAQASPDTKLTAKVTPTSGGSKKKPKNANVTMAFTVNPDANVSADRIEFLLPKNLKVSGLGMRYCPATKINDSPDGPASCPKGSKVGTGSATANLGPDKKHLDFKITIFAASPNELAVYLEGLVTKAIPAAITTAGGDFGQKITINIPPEIQQPVPGLYSSITSTTAKLGPATGSRKVTKKVRGKKRKVKVKTYFVGLTGCPTDKSHHGGVRLHFAPNPNPPAQADDEAQATASCTR